MQLTHVSSLVKESKASVEREQALKFVRAFLDVKDGVAEISQAVVRTVVAVAEHSEDRLRSICIETLAEICELFLAGLSIHSLSVCASGARSATSSMCWRHRPPHRCPGRWHLRSPRISCRCISVSTGYAAWTQVPSSRSGTGGKNALNSPASAFVLTPIGCLLSIY